MPKLSNIITQINAKIALALHTEKFQAGVYYNSIVELLGVSGTEETKPAMIDNDGEGTPVIINDTVPFQIYHRLKSFTHNSFIPEEVFGDGGDFIQEVADMVMIIIADRSRISMRGEDFLSVIAANVPIQFPNSFLTPIDLINCTIEIENTNTKKEEVWQGEYNTPYMLKPNGIMYALNYKTTTIFGKNCFPAC